MQFEKAGEFILNKLKKELPRQLTYHNIYHTLDVRQAAECIGKQENITDAEMKLLLTAACYHDCGYLTTTIGHEERSCSIAEEVLPGFEYDAKDIAQICGMIRATRLPQSPQNKLEQVLADADLDYVGRDDFFIISEQLFLELVALGMMTDRDEWNKAQVKFIENHQYFTPTAIHLREDKKQQNLQQIKAAKTHDIK